MENWRKYLKESPDPGHEPEGAGTLKYYLRRDPYRAGEIEIVKKRNMKIIGRSATW